MAASLGQHNLCILIALASWGSYFIIALLEELKRKIGNYAPVVYYYKELLLYCYCSIFNIFSIIEICMVN